MNKFKIYGLIGFFLVLIILFAGLFTIDENEYAAEVNHGKIVKSYLPGVNWKLPFYNKVVIVYKLKRTSLIDEVLPMINGDSLVNLNLAYDWHVVDFAKYIEFTEYKDDLKNLLLERIRPLSLKYSGLIKFNEQLTSLNQQSLIFESSGVVIDKVYIVGINKGIQNNISQKHNSSADYALAQTIKNNIDIQMQESYHEMEQFNPQFYKLYMYLETIQQQVKSKESVESLEGILLKINH